MKRVRCISIFLVMVSIILGICGCSANLTSISYPEIYNEINLPLVGAVDNNNIEIRVSDQLHFSTSGENVDVYRILKRDPVDTKASINDKVKNVSKWENKEDRWFNRNNNQLLEINKDTGYWFLQNTLILNSIYEETRASELSREQCIAIATEVAELFEVDLDLFSNIKIGNIEYGQAPVDGVMAAPTIVGHEVYFYPVLNGKNVWGNARFNVTIDRNGDVAAINKCYPIIEYASTEKAISQETALNALYNQKAHRMSAAPHEADAAVIDNCELVYYIDSSSIGNDSYCLPYYVFTGRYVKDNVPIEGTEYTVLVPAIE